MNPSKVTNARNTIYCIQDVNLVQFLETLLQSILAQIQYFPQYRQEKPLKPLQFEAADVTGTKDYDSSDIF